MTTITQSITTLPAAPDPATDTPEEFSTAAAVYVLAQKAMVPQLNTWAGQVNTVAGEVNAAVTDAGFVAVAADLVGADTIGTVATAIANVNAVAGISTQVSNVAANTVGWTLSTTTTMADPTSGAMRLNNASPASVTAIAVDDLDSLGNDVSAYVLTWDDSTNTNKGTLTIRQGTAYAVYTVTGLTDNVGWTQLAVTYVSGAGSFADATLSFVGFARAGDVGATGPSEGPLTISGKTGAYTVIAADLGEIINCTANSFTVALTAAATLGVGFNCWIWNTSNTTTDAVTINPNAAETIDGVAPLVLRRGEGVQIVCDGTNWQTGARRAVRGFVENLANNVTRPTASGADAVGIGANALASGSKAKSIGYSSTSSGASSIAIGTSSTASNTNSVAISTGASATSTYSTAIGNNSGATGAQAVTGSGAMALGGSYASGTDSFAAAIANNTSSYGATGANSIAIGYLAKASGAKSVAINYKNIASGAASVAFGGQGLGNSATASCSVAFGDGAISSIYGKIAFASNELGDAGSWQTGALVLRKATTDATPAVLTSDAGVAAATNQVILPNNSTYTFRAQVTAMRKAGDGAAYAGYEITGVITRVANAAATTLLASTVTVLFETTAGWNCVPTADTTNGGLAITVTGAAATNIRWVAVVNTSEVTYA